MFARLATTMLVAAASAIALAGAQGSPTAASGAKEQADGAALFRAHCASCHGVSGLGNGAVAKFLKLPPANLTRISARNGGVFPADRVGKTIDGRQFVRTHGESTMPVWGPIFARSAIPSPVFPR